MDDLTARLGALYSAVVSDVLDDVGFRHATMAPALHGLGAPARMAGRAATLDVIAVDVVPDERYTVQFQAVDRLRAGEIMVVSAPDVPSAFWGELITTRAMVEGCVGAVVDGYTRDLRRIRDHDFGLWARGTHPADSAGRLEAVRGGVPVTCGGVRVEPGDYVLADGDGVVVVPAAMAADVVAAAEEKARTEDTVRETLRAGAGIVETYDRYGVM
ncbi:RraA family protein [Jiangella aurantiaca]|uniref:Putative 4-hydroxy-4-methyl-2-oxoglutarate aldolase n=1 Tax=Jiangella aurantiaca TaxID=2530373 RepID=A0A4R5A117_9ACTN|nr:RraA family protein [Jiangella aurantiaca]TDD64416.1 RraA family protein [Jiangella aurantiaca]